MIDRHNGISAGQVRNSPLQNNRIQNSQSQNSRIQNSRIQNSPLQNNRIQNSRIQNSPLQNSRTQNVTSGGNFQNNSTGSPGTPGAVSFGNMLRSELTRSPAAAQSTATTAQSTTAQSVMHPAQSTTTQSVMHPAQSTTAQSVMHPVQSTTAQSVMHPVQSGAAQSGAVQPVMHPVQNAVNSGIQFSKHALARAEERGIELTDDLMGRLASSVEKAQEKGAKNILAFDNSQAFIINIPYSRVITTMSQAEMRNNLFTNIDGAVLL